MEFVRWPANVVGSLAPYRQGFESELEGQGYTPYGASGQLYLFSHLSRWLEHNGLGAQDMTEVTLKEFMESRRKAGYTELLSERALQHVVAYLRQLGVAPMPGVPDGPLEELLARYRAYLTDERGLTASTIKTYDHYARLFLGEQVTAARLDLHELSGAEVIQFVRRQSSIRSVADAKSLVTALRSVLRFLHVNGEAPARANAVPAVAGWKAAGLPRALSPEQVESILASCDRTMDSGRRDYAMLILLAQLGLRAREVLRLELDDLDWRRGELLVRGKGHQFEHLPLLHAVGEALSEYLVHSRVQGESRRVFVKTLAPAGGLKSVGTVTQALHNACRRCGLAPVGTHWLRRSAGTQMLRAGASLQDVGQVLRHRDLSTTTLYAKLDHRSLRELARPWPVGAA